MPADRLDREVHSSPTEMTSLDELVPFHAVEVFLPDILVLSPPAAHQVRADKNIGAATITGHIVASTDIEQSDLVAVTAFYITKTYPQVKITQGSARQVLIFS